MKCNCGGKDCVSEVGFDSACGLLIAEGNPGACACGIYLSVADAVTLARQLRAYITGAIDSAEVGAIPEGMAVWADPTEAHK